MDNSLKPIESFIQQGLAQRFQQQFGIPLVYSQAPDKKATASKLLQKGFKYPFAFASVTSDAISEGSYKPHTLWRRGITSGVSADSVLAHRLNLIPVTTEYEITFLCQAAADMRRFSKTWLIGAIQNALKFSITFGVVDLDIHVQQVSRVEIPQREGGLTEVRQYEATTSLTVSAYMSRDELAKAQAVIEVQPEIIVDSSVEAIAVALETVMPFGVPTPGKPYVLTPVAEDLTGTTYIDLATLGDTYDLVLTADRTVGTINGTSAMDGRRFLVRIKQGAPGGWLVTWDPASIGFGSDIPSVQLSTVSGEIDYIGMVYRHSVGKCEVIAFTRGYL